MKQWHELKYISWEEMQKLPKDIRGIPTYCAGAMFEGRFTLVTWPVPEGTLTYAVLVQEQDERI